MSKQTYSKENFAEMEPMHDSSASKIQVLDNTLIITYDDLDKGAQNADGSPYYKHKRLVVKYEFDSFCEVKLYYGKNKYKRLGCIESNCDDRQNGLSVQTMLSGTSKMHALTFWPAYIGAHSSPPAKARYHTGLCGSL